MKKTVLYIGVALLFLSSCEADKNNNPSFPFTVTIKTLEDSTRVANVFIEILAQPGGGQNKLLFEGFSNERGEARFEYDKEAVLLIRGTRGTRPAYTWIGCDYIFLQANKEATRTVYIRPFNPEVEGC